jgi:hypothetical protein
MRSVLDTYVFYRPDVGYVQGMSYLVAMLLVTNPKMDTSTAFTVSLLIDGDEQCIHGESINRWTRALHSL